ncbi:hypothetical protein LXM60_07100 [Pandoraea sputorum]|uniref:hypothetical protein n=1 Tax=Pandoraea sputorum TaxID=93222 RepID=UPI001E2BCF5B|nr:hypothetical protein [Pandoraea sputorum]MCE4059971.1 hypothetical protein [Pandoraea sputorum]
MAELLGSPNDLRRSYLAAVVLYHTTDHYLVQTQGRDAALANGRKSPILELVKKLSASCPEFLLVRDIADATKHCELRPQKEVPRGLVSAASIRRPSGTFSAPFGTAVFGEASIVTVTTDNGERFPLIGILITAYNMWAQLLMRPQIGESQSTTDLLSDSPRE